MQGAGLGGRARETADGPCGVCSCQHPQLSCRAQEVRPETWEDLGAVTQGHREGREGKGSGRVGRAAGAACLQPGLAGGRGTLRGHSAPCRFSAQWLRAQSHWLGLIPPSQAPGGTLQGAGYTCLI